MDTAEMPFLEYSSLVVVVVVVDPSRPWISRGISTSRINSLLSLSIAVDELKSKTNGAPVTVTDKERPMTHHCAPEHREHLDGACDWWWWAADVVVDNCC